MLSIISIFRWNECSSLFCMRHCSSKQCLYLIKSGPLSFYYSTLCRITHVFALDRWTATRCGDMCTFLLPFKPYSLILWINSIKRTAFPCANQMIDWLTAERFLFWTKGLVTHFQLVACFGTILLWLCSSILGQPQNASIQSTGYLVEHFPHGIQVECNSELLRQQ